MTESKIDCIFCKIISGEIDYYGQLKEYEHWNVIVSREQHTLGTIVIQLKRHTVRFSDLTSDELLEFNVIQKELESALDNLFAPDLYNYLQCGNQMKHLHIHMIPRYSKEIEFKGKVFTDENYGDSVKETTIVEEESIVKSLKEDILFG